MGLVSAHSSPHMAPVPSVPWAVNRQIVFSVIEGLFEMHHRNKDLRADFIEVLDEVSTLMSIAYEELGPVPEDHALAQAGLENGREVVLDYVDHNEAGVAFEHLLYMIDEPPLMISKKCGVVLARIAMALEMPFNE